MLVTSRSRRLLWQREDAIFMAQMSVGYGYELSGNLMQSFITSFGSRLIAVMSSLTSNNVVHSFVITSRRTDLRHFRLRATVERPTVLGYRYVNVVVRRHFIGCG